MGNDEAGLRIAPGQPRQLADAMRSLLIDPERTVELGKKAFERFQQSFTYDRFIANTISVYEKLLSKKVN
jgi:O-antigen biosynthesis rhamnosyltransferase